MKKKEIIKLVIAVVGIVLTICLYLYINSRIQQNIPRMEIQCIKAPCEALKIPTNEEKYLQIGSIISLVIFTILGIHSIIKLKK